MLKTFGCSRYFWSSSRCFNVMSTEFQTIGTHNGTFHCDEVLGCFMLKLLNKDAKIVRSRDMAVLDTCDVVIDVGNVFDPVKLRFDHHQKGFEHTFNSLKPEMPFHIKLSSAGLVYCHFGETIIKKILGEINKEVLSHVYKQVYESFLIEVDGIDNGVEMCEGNYKYDINTHLSKRVSHFNKKWNDKSSFDEDAAFAKAMELAGNEFVENVNFTYNVWWPARKVVMDAISERYDVHESGEIVRFDEWVPFIRHLLFLEKSMNIQVPIKYALYKDGENWRIRAVPIAESSFICRVPLLKSWQGLREDDLIKAGAPPGVIFVHNTGFIGGHRQYQGALEMAVKSLLAAK